MIIYSKHINEFVNDINSKRIVNEINAQLIEKLGSRVSKAEERSWENSLYQVSKSINHLSDKNIGVHIEYMIPRTQNRIDIMFTGVTNEGLKALRLVELKQWSKAEQLDEIDRVSIGRYDSIKPGYQAAWYLMNLMGWNSKLEKYDVKGGTYMHNMDDAYSEMLEDFDHTMWAEKIEHYYEDDGQRLADEFVEPLGKSSKDDLTLINKELSEPDEKPTKSFIEVVKNCDKNIPLSPSQADALGKLKVALGDGKGKTFIIVKGAAGTGKSIIAIKLGHYAITHLGCNPKVHIPGQELQSRIKREFKKTPLSIGGAKSQDRHDFDIIDEAHKAAAQNGAKDTFTQCFKKGCPVVALMDDDQMINKKGITIATVKNLAESMGYKVHIASLYDQFRCGGNGTYTKWLKKMLFNADNGQEMFVNGNGYDFIIHDDENEFIESYKSKYKKEDVRMVKFWTHGWGDQSVDENGDIKKLLKIGDYDLTWWVNNNFIKSLKKTKPSAATKKIAQSNIQEDKPGWEYIAYFNHIQGAEFEKMYVYLDDLVYIKNGRLEINFNDVEKIQEMTSQLWMKNKKVNPEKYEENRKFWLNRLNVMLTRGLKETHVYIQDPKLKEYFVKTIK